MNSFDGLYVVMCENNRLILTMEVYGRLNILFQNKWDVYNNDNRDIVQRITREKELSRWL